MGAFRQAGAAATYARFTIDGSNSVTIFPSATGSRWVLTGGFISWGNVSVSTNFSFIETYDSGSTVFFNWDASGTIGVCNFHLGSVGIQASEAYSGFKLAVDVGATSTGSYSGIFSGYYTGGG